LLNVRLFCAAFVHTTIWQLVLDHCEEMYDFCTVRRPFNSA
jgi:hypothetical protein